MSIVSSALGSFRSEASGYHGQDRGASQLNTNTAEIASNASNISANSADVASNVVTIGTNATGIATNATNIATNATNIVTNVTDIATNLTDIASNAALIAALMAPCETVTSLRMPEGTTAIGVTLKYDVLSDIDGNWGAVAGEYVAPRNGWYLYAFSGYNHLTWTIIDFLKNDVVIVRISQYGGLHYTGLIQLDVDDTFDVRPGTSYVHSSPNSPPIRNLLTIKCFADP